jgi:hypothetical protein
VLSGCQSSFSSLSFEDGTSRRAFVAATFAIKACSGLSRAFAIFSQSSQSLDKECFPCHTPPFIGKSL